MFHLVRWNFGSSECKLEANDNSGVAPRTCIACGLEHFVCERQEHWSVAEPETWQVAERSSTSTNRGVGFSLYADSTDIKSLYIGYRCSSGGVLGCFAGSEVGYGPSLDYLLACRGA